MQSSRRSLYLTKWKALKKAGYLQKEMPSRTAFWSSRQKKNNTMQKIDRKVLEVVIQKLYSFKIFQLTSHLLLLS